MLIVVAVFVVMVVYMICATLVADAAERKGRPRGAWLAISLCLLPLAFIMVACMREEPKYPVHLG